jgi:hypothetical protein
MAQTKTLTIDGFYSNDEAKRINQVMRHILNFDDQSLGKELNNFNMVPDDASEIFSRALGFPVTVNLERSGTFRKPDHFIHFEDCETSNDWMFFVALDETIFNIYEHASGAEHALQGYQFNYRNLFEWEHRVNYHLKPGQGIFFRPWLFHSVISGMVQVFRAIETCQ